jgi:hypothetical protein
MKIGVQHRPVMFLRSSMGSRAIEQVAAASFGHPQLSSCRETDVRIQRSTHPPAVVSWQS